MDNPSNIHSPHLGKSLSLRLHTLGGSGQTPAGFAQIWHFWVETAREKNPILWEMAPQFQMETAGKSCLTQEQSSERQIPAGLPLPSTAQGQGLSPAAEKGVKGSHKERERAGMGSSLPAPPALLKEFISITLLTARPEGEGKGFHLPSNYGKHQ